MPLKPPLKWAGGKRWLVPTLQKLFQLHQHRRLVEPFCGGLSVALGLLPERALLADLNPHLINFYQQLQSADGLKIPTIMENASERFYENRELFNSMIASGNVTGPEAAGLFYYLNRTGFNGLCRFNNSGFFNVPFGKYKSINYTVDFSEYQSTLKNWQFAISDFESLKINPDDFIYADPPYDVPFTKYAKVDFTWTDQERLAIWLSRHPGPVVVSNQATERVLELFRAHGFQVMTLPAPRRISSTGDRTDALEVLAVRNVE